MYVLYIYIYSLIMFSLKMAFKSRNMSVYILKKLINFVIPHIINYLIIGSEHDRDALPKNLGCSNSACITLHTKTLTNILELVCNLSNAQINSICTRLCELMCWWRGGKQQSEEINLDSPIRETGGWGGCGTWTGHSRTHIFLLFIPVTHNLQKP